MKYFKYVFLFFIVASFTVQFIYIISPILTLSLIQKIVLVMIQILAIIGFTHFHLYFQSEEKKNRGRLIAHWVVFTIYVLNLLYVLFLDPDFGRQMHKEALSFEEYWKYNVNLDLFETIQLFIKGYQRGIVSLETILRNLLGNMVVFMPMAYFLPALFVKQRKFILFFLTMIVMVAGVEVIQVILRIGSGDVDDLFLNVLGAMIMYIILRCLPFLKRWQDRKG